MLKNVVTVKPFVPEHPESETPEKPEDKYKSSWIYKYFVWIEVVLVIGGILPTHRPKQRWRRYLMYIYIFLMFMLHSYNLGRSVALFFTTSIGFISNTILTSSYLMTWLLVVATSKRTRFIRPFLEQFSELYESKKLPISNYQKAFIKFSNFYAIATIVCVTGAFIYLTLNMYIFYDLNPFLEIVIAPLNKDDPITKKVAILFVLQWAISVPPFFGSCWLFLSVTLVLYKEYRHVNTFIEKSVREKNLKGKIEEFRIHHEKLNGLLGNADDLLNAVTGNYSLSVIGLFCLAAYDVAGGVGDVIIFMSLLSNLIVVIIVWLVIISGCIHLNDQVNN